MSSYARYGHWAAICIREPLTNWYNSHNINSMEGIPILFLPIAPLFIAMQCCIMIK